MEYEDILSACPLFAGIEKSELSALLQCLGAKRTVYEKDAVILLAGAPVSAVGLILHGCAHIYREDSYGKPNLLAQIETSDLFGEVFAFAGVVQSPVTVLAAEKATVLHMDYRKMIVTCPNTCAFHSRLIQNMLALVARKNLQLNQKIEILSKRTTRERLLTYLHCVAGEQTSIYIPFNREELAAYLCVERSALSAELSKMQADGLLHFNRNHFEIL